MKVKNKFENIFSIEFCMNNNTTICIFNMRDTRCRAYMSVKSCDVEKIASRNSNFSAYGQSIRGPNTRVWAETIFGMQVHKNKCQKFI